MVEIEEKDNKMTQPEQEKDQTEHGQPNAEEPVLDVSTFINSERLPVGVNDINYSGVDGVPETSKSSVMTVDPGVPLPRMVLRSLPFSQSLNQVEVRHNQRFKIFQLLFYDWFHVVLRMNTITSLLLFLSIWTVCLLIFAIFYVEVDNMNPYEDCGLGKIGSPITYGPAFAFSLETCTTGMCDQSMYFLFLFLNSHLTWCSSFSFLSISWIRFTGGLECFLRELPVFTSCSVFSDAF